MHVPLQSFWGVVHIRPLVVPVDVLPGVASFDELEQAAAPNRNRITSKRRNLSVDFIPNSLR
jgi:hypothetical protein